MEQTVLARLAELIKARNAVHAEMSALIGRPAQIGHLGEYIAANIFGIELNDSASHKGVDGFFMGGPLDGRSVNIKWYTRRQNMIDLNTDALPDDYLVLTGPRSAPASSRGTALPWVIRAVYLFDANELVGALRARNARIGIATPVAAKLWDQAEIYPEQRNPRLVLSERQWDWLALFGSAA